MKPIIFVIMGVKGRERLSGSLQRQIITSGGACRVFLDSGYSGHRIAAQNAWENAATLGDPVVMLEDDIIICDGFVELANAAIAARPDELISGFVMSKKVAVARAKGFSWGVASSLAWNQMVYIPMSMIEDVVRFSRESVASECKYWDVTMTLYAKLSTRRFFFTVPCLVQHMNSQSTIGNHPLLFGRPRIAEGFEQSPGPIDFSDLRAFDFGGQPLANYTSDLVSNRSD